MLLASAVPLFLSIPLSHDAAWQMWLGRQLWHGAAFGRDVVEVNPPLWFWIAAPLAGFAEALQLPSRQVAIGFLLIAIATSLWLLARLVRERPAGERALLLATALSALLLIPLRDFAQREHFALVAALPYATLAARRSAGAATLAGLAALVGLLAATGFLLKPHFLLVPLLLELWLWRRAGLRPVRPESMALLAAALAYGIAVPLFAPAWLANVVPLAGLAYGGFGDGFDPLPLLPVGAMLLFAGTALALARPTGPALARALVVAAAGFFIAYALQGKGWRYHTLPAAALLAVAAGALLAETRSRRALVAACASAILLLAATFPLQGVARNPLRSEVEQLIAEVPPGTPVLALTASAAPLWPLVEERKLVWPSRYFAYWMLPAAVHDPARLAPLAARIRSEAALDMACTPPHLLLVDRNPDGGLLPRGFDTLGWFAAEPRFAALLARYREVGRSTHFRVFQLVRASPRPDHCRVIH